MSYNLQGLRLVTLEGLRGGLGIVDISKAQDVLEFHFGNMSSWTKGAILVEAIQSKYDTISKEVSVALVDICDYALSGLSPDDLKNIVLKHISSFNANTRMAILSEATSGKFTTLIKEIAKTSDSICRAIAQSLQPKNSENPETKGTETKGIETDNSWMIYAGGALVVAGAIYYYTSKPKSKKRGKK